MSEIFKIILSFFHNRNEGMMFVHPVTHDAHGLALKKECALAHSRGVFLSYGNEVSYTIKKPCAGALPKHRASYSYFIGKPYSCTSTNIL